MFAKIRSVFERVSMAIWLHREMDFVQWSNTSLRSLLQAWGKKLTQKFLSPPHGRGCAALTALNHTEDSARRGRRARQSCSQITVLASAEHWHVSQEAQLSLVTHQPRCQPDCRAPREQANTCPWPRHHPASPNLLPRGDSETICYLSRGGAVL